MEFSTHIPAIVLEETPLTSFDVTSLHTNVPLYLGLTTVGYWIEEKRDEMDSIFESNFILEVIRIVRQANIFHFDGKRYIQIKDTAFGIEVVPTYTNSVTGYLEHQMYRQISVQNDQNVSYYVIRFWQIYLDD